MLTDFLYNQIYSFLHIVTQHKTSNKMKGLMKKVKFMIFCHSECLVREFFWRV